MNLAQTNLWTDDKIAFGWKNKINDLTSLLSEGLHPENEIFSNYVTHKDALRLVSSGLIKENYSGHQYSLTERGCNFIIKYNLVERAESHPDY